MLADSDFSVFCGASDESARADIYQAIVLFAAEFIDALDMHMPREGKLHAVIRKERSNGAPIPDLGVAHEVKNGHGWDNRVMADRKNKGVRGLCGVELSLRPPGQTLVDTTLVVCGAVAVKSQHPDARRYLRHVGIRRFIDGESVGKPEFIIDIAQLLKFRAINRHTLASPVGAGAVIIVVTRRDDKDLFAAVLEPLQLLDKAPVALFLAVFGEIARYYDYIRLFILGNAVKYGFDYRAALFYEVKLAPHIVVKGFALGAERRLKIMSIGHKIKTHGLHSYHPFAAKSNISRLYDYFPFNTIDFVKDTYRIYNSFCI